ncbi:MAG: HDIG domain-containing protein [Clostridia bacterium]|nr:HDIG domain-containing protein [Clostridia bacterium]
MNAVNRKTEWNRGMAVGSVICFLVNLVVLLLLLTGLLVVEKYGQFTATFKDNSANYAYIAFCVILLIWITYFYFFFENRKLLADAKRVTMVFVLVEMCVALSWAFGRYVNIYARPVALAGLLALTLVGRRDAIFLNVVCAFLIFILDNFASTAQTPVDVYSSLVIAFSAGMIAIFLGNKIKTRLQVVWIGIIIVIPMEIIIFLLEICSLAAAGATEAAIATETVFRSILTNMGFGLLGGLLSAVFFLAILPVFESLFNCLTAFRLRELTDTDAKLLRKLKEGAPGTYNHSAVVAQLAEACAESIGEDADLARAAAFYHDVGKLHQPEYFTENQDEYNLHDELTPELSADIIRSHTQDGFDLIRNHHLPQFFADVAREHHGTLPIRYFYAKALKMTDGELNIEDFSYTGPKPRSKIAAIIMIADASEAVSRALTKRSPEEVEKAVSGIIEERMDLEQFSDCDITMKDLTVIRETLVNTLSGVYHHRVKYPTIKYTRKGGKTMGEGE